MPKNDNWVINKKCQLMVINAQYIKKQVLVITNFDWILKFQYSKTQIKKKEINLD